MIKIYLPLKTEYRSFIESNEHLKNVSCVYKLTFKDGLFYIGMTNNLASRIYNHVTLTEKGASIKSTTKQIRMSKAITNEECVTFEIIDYDARNERKHIESSWQDYKLLNMKKV